MVRSSGWYSSSPSPFRRMIFSDSIPAWLMHPLAQFATNSRHGIMPMVEICHLYISAGHNFFGHHGREADKYPAIEVLSVECIAGHGIRGDRFFDYRDDYKGQITFFSIEVFDELCGAFQ